MTADPHLPTGWHDLKLGEVADVRLGRQRSPKNHAGNFMRPYLRAANVTWRGLSLDDVKEMNFTEAEMETFRLLPGDVLVNEASGSPREVGKAAIFGGEIADCAFQNTLLRVRPSERLATPFLHLCLTYLALTGAHLEDARGVGIAHLGRAKLAARAIPVPPLAEQEQIVAVVEEQVSRLDAALASIRTVRTKADQFRRSLLHAAFSGSLTGHAEAEWPMTSLNDLVATKSDIVDGPFGSNLKSAHYVEEGARVIRLQNIGFGDFLPGDAFITQDHFDTLVKHNVREGDLLFASLGENLPRACLAPKFDEPAIVKADCIRVRLRPDVNHRFVLHATQRPEAKGWAREALHGMGRPRLGLGTIRTFPLPVPPRSIQDMVVEVIEAQTPNLAATLASADRAEAMCAALRRSLLHAAFTGQLTEEWRKTHG